jgi:serine/threonine protein kinase
MGIKLVHHHHHRYQHHRRQEKHWYCIMTPATPELPRKSQLSHTIFLEAIEIADFSLRLKYINAACGSDDDLRHQVEALLAAHDRLGTFLEVPILQDKGACRLILDQQDLEGGQLGVRYSLIRKIGSGGIGQVWLAEQHEPVHRNVAIKLIRPGMDSERILARFRAESQTLALLSHPHIATVLDGGLTPEGRPFFVMELVQGIPVTDYCNQERLTLVQRLQLIATICRAVDYAHQQGVIHRDLKPQNLLIASPGGQPVPKIIDFGMAKVIVGDVTKNSQVTGSGWFSGTPEYMSPEQTSAGAIPTDRRSDVYSLGVLLCHLLTGRPPFRQTSADPAALLEFFRTVREVAAPRPSALIGGPESRDVCESMGLTQAKLTKSLRTDPDWVILRALEKAPQDRYQSAAELADDLECIAAGLPPRSPSPNLLRRLRYVLKSEERRWLAGAGLAIAVLAAGAKLNFSLQPEATMKHTAAFDKTSVERAREQAFVAEETALQELRIGLKATLERLLTAGPAQQSLAKAALDDSVSRWNHFANVVGDDHRSEVIRTEALLRIGGIHRALAQLEKARPMLQQAVSRLDRLRIHHPDDNRVAELYAESQYELARLECEQGNHEIAAQLFRQSVDTQSGLTDKQPLNSSAAAALGVYKRDFGKMLRTDFDAAQAELELQESVELFKKLTQRETGNIRWKIELESSRTALASTLRVIGENEQALQLLEESVKCSKTLSRQLPENHEIRRIIAAQQQLQGLILMEFSRLIEAKQSLTEALELQNQLTGLFQMETDLVQKQAATLNTLGVVYARAQQFTAAEGRFLEAQLVLEKLAAGHPDRPDFQNDLANVLNSRAAVLLAEQKLPEARKAADQMWQLRLQLCNQYPNVPDYAYTMAVGCNIYGQLLLRLQQPTEAVPVLEQGIQILQKLMKQFSDVPQHQQTLANLLYSRAQAAKANNDLKTAESAFMQAIEIRSAMEQQNPPSAAFAFFAIQCQNGVASVRRAAGDLPGALAALQKSRTYIQYLPPSTPHKDAIETLTQLLDVLPQVDSAANTDDIKKQLNSLVN